MNKNKILGLLYLSLALILLTAPTQASQKRTRFMGSSLFTVPTGYTRSSMSYISDDKDSIVMYSQLLAGNFVEVSLRRHLNGEYKGKNITGFKLNILKEDLIVPSVVWGVSDFTTELGKRVNHFAASKSLEAFGVSLHAGTYKDPVTDERIKFYGVEKMIFPLVTLAAERIEEKNTVGIKLSPYPGFSLEYSKRLKASGHSGDIYKLHFFQSF